MLNISKLHIISIGLLGIFISQFHSLSIVHACYVFPAEKLDPCLDLKCPPGSKCLPSQDGHSATCQCPNKCPSYGDSTGSRPLCGADGRDYANLCELQKASCIHHRPIEIKFQGLCDPCTTLNCPAPSVCLLDADRRPKCSCGEICPSDFQPVCGSDGRSYSSQCHLLQEACRTQRHLRILYKGLCETGIHPCHSAGCETDEICQVDEKGIAQCLCPGPCPPIQRPVCASDQRTYSSHCELQREACLQRKNFTLMYEGMCGYSQACSDYRCPPGGYCVETSPGIPSCHCPSCGGEWDPVCGSDGITYTNPCRLRLEACTNNKSIHVVYKGLCNGCDKKQCDFYASCEMDEMGRTQCVCPKGCSELPNSEVCGTDGVTYRNECELKLVACRKQQFIVVASSGDCDICKNIQCHHGARCEDGICVCPTHCPLPSPTDPVDLSGVCANDGRTYLTECHMQKTACDNETPLQVLHMGPCPTTAADLVLGEFHYDNETFIHPHRKCNCHKQGSIDDTCDPVTLQCRCRTGVGGRTCDRCLSGFWGLHQISTHSNGCEPCNCHPLGSIRDDCEQMTGRCVCRSHAVGPKCDRCQDGQLIDDVPQGCGHGEISEHESRHCSALTCRYGAICQNVEGEAHCVCPMDCPVSTSAEHTVCGSDGVSYGSECDLRLAACRKQIGIDLLYEGPCAEDVTTKAPVSDLDTAVSKATRHVQAADITLLDWSRRDIISLSQMGSKSNQYGYSQPVWRPTVATVHIGGFLGEPCANDGDCHKTANSICHSGTCTCADGFAENSDHRYCVANIPLVTPEISSCSSSPCHGGGTCQPLGLESFICICPPERTGSLCERTISQTDDEVNPTETPAFHGQSFIELKKMKAHDKFSIEMEFKSLLADGILLYAQQRQDSASDFLSIALVSGHVELRFNLGNGPVILRSVQPIRLGHWHRIIAHRYRQDGWLRLDNDEDVATTSPGSHSSLDLDSNTFLGSVPLNMVTTRVYENIGTTSGFVGCMRRLKLGRRSVNFHIAPDGRKGSRHSRHFEDRNRGNSIDTFTPIAPIQKQGSNMIIQLNGITQCGDNPCRKTPCANEGTCVLKNGYNFTCLCKQGYTGKLCESQADPCASNPCADGSTCIASNNRFTCKCSPGRKGTLCNQHDGSKHEILVPEFNTHTTVGSSSFVAISKNFQIGNNLDLEVWFLSRSADGILVYSAQDFNGRGDFIWLALIGGRLQFRWDLGSGAGIVTSPERVTLFEWHRVLVSRRGKEANIRLDDGSIYQGRSLGPLSELNLDTPVFIGGLKPNTNLPRDVPKLSNLQGAVQRVIINGEVIDKLMDSSIEQHNVAVYRGPPCGHLPITHQTRGSSFKESSTPCLHGGICQPLLTQFVCKCLPGYIGKRCEKRINESTVTKPVYFDGKTFLKYPNQIKDVIKSQRSNRFEIKFRTESDNGLLLWLSRGNSLQADYFAVAVVHSKVELSFNLGKQIAFLSARSTINVSDGQWHTVIIDRKKRLGTVQVDGEKPVRATADPGATILNSNGKLWIGGNGHLPPGLPFPYYQGFNGCIEYVKVDRHDLDWQRHGDNAILHYCGDT